MAAPSLSSPPPGIVPGKKYRFTVESAEEAVRTLQQRLGPRARVLSVAQVEGKGLSRFMGSPRLEIIAQVDPEEPAAPAPAAQAKAAAPDPEPAQAHAADKLDLRSDEDFGPGNDEPSPAEADEPAPRTTASVAPGHGLQDAMRRYGNGGTPQDRPLQGTDVWKILRKSGFDPSLIERLQEALADKDLASQALPHALAEVSAWLRSSYHAESCPPLTNRVVFLGPPGVGKTTALCKRLAQTVLVDRTPAQVCKLETETPNADDGLDLFCNVLGVPFSRSVAAPNATPADTRLFVDTPGCWPHEDAALDELRDQLDAHKLDTRILVLHGGFAGDLVTSVLRQAETLGITHLALTHLDAVPNVTRWWPLLLSTTRRPLFISHGAMITGECRDDVLAALLERTFPPHLSRLR